MKKTILSLGLAVCGALQLLAESPTPVAGSGEFPLKLEDIRVRDPFILAEGGIYYLYAQGGNRARNDAADLGIEVYRSHDLVHWSQPKQVFARPKEGFWGNPPIWAPEVHKLDGAYYIFATMAGRAGGRGTQILRAERAEGPFLVTGEQASTPPEQRCLDGTPWIDHDGTHWMIYCHEWEQIRDGGMLAVKMSKDWTTRLGEPITLFHASQAPWVRPYPKPDTYVTDGPFLHRMKNGKLVMIWSSFVKGHGYGIGQAISESGTVVGPWRHVEKPLVGGAGEDGGHAMILKDFSGGLLLVFHQPNGGHAERAKIYRLQEDGDLLVLDGLPRMRADEAASSKPVRILCVGDSITIGATDNPKWEVPFEFGYRSGLFKRLVQAGYRVQFVGSSPEPWDGRGGVPKNSPSPDLRALGQDHHEGHGGWKTDRFLQNIDQWLERAEPDIVLLMIGINDNGGPHAAQNLKGIMEKIVAARPQAYLLVAQITPTANFSQSIVDYNTTIRDTLVPDLQRRGLKVGTVDQYRHFLKPDGTIDGARFSNQINHPDAIGYDRIAQSWFEAIQSILPTPK
jgi:GH43 family beta-xylosidase/lysophospholipase L1-like esterase